MSLSTQEVTLPPGEELEEILRRIEMNRSILPPREERPLLDLAGTTEKTRQLIEKYRNIPKADVL